MKELKVLIAPWGDPIGWQKVKYFYSGREKELRTGLPLLAEVEQIPTDNILILIPDSTWPIIPSSVREDSRYDYDYIKKQVENKVTQFLGENGVDNPKNVNVGIVYASGIFNLVKSREDEAFLIKFEGNPRDAYHKIWAVLTWFLYYKVFKKLDVSFPEKLEVIVDTTHGLNYLTVFTFHALYELLQLLSYRITVSLKVFNSDPLIRFLDKQELTIHEILNETIVPNFSVRRNINEDLEQNKRYYFIGVFSEGEHRDASLDDILNDFENSFKEEKWFITNIIKSKGGSSINFSSDDEMILPYLCFIRAFEFHLPFWVWYFNPENEYWGNKDLERLWGWIDKVVSVYEKGIDVKVNLDKGSKYTIIVRRNFNFGEAYLWLQKAFWVHFLTRDLWGNNRCIRCENLKNYCNKLLEGKLPSVYVRVIQNIVSFCEEKHNNKSESKSRDRRIRNFIAHSGLLDYLIFEDNKKCLFPKFEKAQKVKEVIKFLNSIGHKITL